MSKLKVKVKESWKVYLKTNKNMFPYRRHPWRRRRSCRERYDPLGTLVSPAPKNMVMDIYVCVSLTGDQLCMCLQSPGPGNVKKSAWRIGFVCKHVVDFIRSIALSTSFLALFIMHNTYVVIYSVRYEREYISKNLFLSRPGRKIWVSPVSWRGRPHIDICIC